MKSKQINYQNKKYEELLDSDDELPPDYVETPYIPAYQNEERFKKTQFDWKDITKKKDEYLDLVQSRKIEQENRILIKGIMHQNDIFLSKCIEEYDYISLLWFVNFLLMKDLQSNYKFLVSCLVPIMQPNSFLTSDSTCYIETNEKQKYKIKITK